MGLYVDSEVWSQFYLLPSCLSMMTLIEELSEWLSDAERLTIVGVGNVMRGDDGFGVEVVRRLKELGVPPNVQLIEAGQVPESFLGVMRRFKPTHILFVDAAIQGLDPGELRLLDPRDELGMSISTHKIPLRLLCEYVEQTIGSKTAILAAQPKQVGLGEGLSEPVRRGVEEAAGVIHKALKEKLGGMSVVEAEEGEMLDVELEESFLKRNMELAEMNRRMLREHGVKAVDILGSIGSGKTSLVACMVELLKDRYRIGYIAGDLTTTIDADRIARHGVPVVQVNTGKECHLDASLVAKALAKMNLDELDLIFIENVGNLICPAEFPLGSDRRIVVVSVTEGPYMVVKHPYIFMEADVAVINKVDLAEAMGVDVDALERDALRINPKIKVVRTNCRKCEGVEGVIEALGL